MNLKTTAITEQFADMERLDALALEAFPPNEYIAPAKLIELSKDGLDLRALYDGELFVGFMAVLTRKSMAYLFYFAISPALRSRGCGSAALRLLKELYPHAQQTVDLEILDDSAHNAAQRRSRRAFYLRNGYKPTGMFVSYLGMDLEILCAGEAFDFELFKETLSSLKIDGLRPKYYVGGIPKS